MQSKSNVLSKHSCSILLFSYFILYLGVYQLFFMDEILETMGFQTYIMINIVVMVAFLIFFIVIGFRWYDAQWNKFCDIFRSGALEVLKGVLLLFALNIFVSIFIQMIFPITPAENQVNNEFVMMLSPFNAIFGSAIFAPFIEETVFRGCIFAKIRERHSFWLAAFINGTLFGFLHIFASILARNWINCVYIFLHGTLGMVLCLPYERTGSIFTSIFTHSLFNLLGILMML